MHKLVGLQLFWSGSLFPVGLLLFARWESLTPVFKILVRALRAACLFHPTQTHLLIRHSRAVNVQTWYFKYTRLEPLHFRTADLFIPLDMACLWNMNIYQMSDHQWQQNIEPYFLYIYMNISVNLCNNIDHHGFSIH